MSSKEIFAKLEAAKYALSPKEIDDLVRKAVKAQMDEWRAQRVTKAARSKKKRKSS